MQPLDRPQAMTVPFNRQRGSTLTGLIIGLIIGLGIAVAVALTITKGASPFTDKTAKMGRPADPTPGQAADPNKPMYGNRDAAREAAKQLADKPRARKARCQPQPRRSRSAGAGDRRAEGPAGHAGRLRSARAKPAAAGGTAETAPAAASASGDKYVYYLQAGAFREMSDAENDPRQAGPARLRGGHQRPHQRQRHPAPRAPRPVQPGRSHEQGARQAARQRRRRRHRAQPALKSKDPPRCNASPPVLRCRPRPDRPRRVSAAPIPEAGVAIPDPAHPQTDRPARRSRSSSSSPTTARTATPSSRCWPSG
jgi:cell division protein FtsN